MINYIHKYYQQIKDGSVNVGKWIERVYEYVIKGLENQDFYFDQKKATHALKWIKDHVHHSEGELAPGLLKLETWQKAIISVLFGCVDEDGSRHFRECFIVIGRKNGKSLLAAAILAYMIYGEEEYGAKGFCVAPKLEQADIVLDAFWQSVQLDKELKAMTKSRKSDKYIKRTNSSVKKLPFTAKRSDGLNPQIVVCDEIAAWEGDKGLKQYNVMASALGSRRQPLLLSITTAGYVNDGIYDELMKRATRLLMGESNERRFIPFLYMIDDIENWASINECAKANPNLSVSVRVDYLLEEIAKAELSLSNKNEFLTKHCCIKQNSSAAWLPAEVVAKATGEHLDIKDFAHSYCVAGIDLSQTTDLTACVVIIEKNGKLNVFAKMWLPAEKIDEATERDGVPYNTYIERGLLETSGDNFIDYKDCYKWLTHLVEEYEILPLMVGYDRYSAQYLINDLKAYGFRVDDVYQGDNLHPVIQETDGRLRNNEFNIGDNDLLKMHLLNSAIKHNTQRNRGRLVKIHPNAHIDGTAALLDAMTVRQKWYEQIGEQLKNED